MWPREPQTRARQVQRKEGLLLHEIRSQDDKQMCSLPGIEYGALSSVKVSHR